MGTAQGSAQKRVGQDDKGIGCAAEEKSRLKAALWFVHTDGSFSSLLPPPSSLLTLSFSAAVVVFGHDHVLSNSNSQDTIDSLWSSQSYTRTGCENRSVEAKYWHRLYAEFVLPIGSRTGSGGQPEHTALYTPTDEIAYTYYQGWEHRPKKQSVWWTQRLLFLCAVQWSGVSVWMGE